RARQAAAGMAAGGDSVRWPPPKNERVVPLPAKLTSELRIAECVATGPLEEIWQAVDVNNRKRLVKIVYGLSNHAASVRDAVEQLKAIHHPALVTQDVVLAEPGRMVIVTDAIKETLRDCFYQCRKRKQPGIVRPELIEYLRAAAEVLDYLYQQYGLFHGCLHPRQFVLDHGWLQLADFGIAQLFWQPGGQDVATYNARYAAPEQYHQTAHRNSDQYALALIYAEMLTGFHPFHCRSAAARHGVEPDLERLPPVDREVIARALSYDPNKRWPNCTAMMLALEGTSVECLRAIEQDLDPFARLIEQNKNKPHDADIVGTSPGDLNRLVHDIITSTAGDTFNDDTQLVPTMADDHVEQSFCIGLPIGTARSRLHGLAQRWFGQVIRDQERILVFRLSLPASFWRQLLGRRSGIEVRVELSRIHPRSATPIRVTVRAELLRKRDAASRELLAELAPQIIAELQQVLGTDADKRVQDRLLWPHPLKVTPILADGTREEPIECRGKDISKSGIGFYLPHDLATTQVLIELPNDVHPPSIAIPATLVRAKRCADGWYEVGALFRFPALRKSYPQIILPVTHARCPA
ncbi:MAG: protein kinase, partial [Gemmataceae bacterium]|nr:protein kinase [Gemmataceae bacterium]